MVAWVCGTRSNGDEAVKVLGAPEGSGDKYGIWMRTAGVDEDPKVLAGWYNVDFQGGTPSIQGG